MHFLHSLPEPRCLVQLQSRGNNPRLLNTWRKILYYSVTAVLNIRGLELVSSHLLLADSVSISTQRCIWRVLYTVKPKKALICEGKQPAAQRAHWNTREDVKNSQLTFAGLLKKTALTAWECLTENKSKSYLMARAESFQCMQRTIKWNIRKISHLTIML